MWQISKQTAAVIQTKHCYKDSLCLDGFVVLIVEFPQTHTTPWPVRYAKEIPCRVNRDTPHKTFGLESKEQGCYIFAGSKTSDTSQPIKPNNVRYPGSLCFTRDEPVLSTRCWDLRMSFTQHRLEELDRFLHIWETDAWGSETDRKSFLQLLWSRWMTQEDLRIKCHMDHGVFQEKATILGAWQVTEAMFKALASTRQSLSTITQTF